MRTEAHLPHTERGRQRRRDRAPGPLDGPPVDAHATARSVRAVDIALHVHRSGSDVVLRGELDAATAPVLRRATRELIGPDDVVVDAAGLTFVDAGGLGVLAVLARDLAARGGRLRVVRAPATLRRLSALCQLDAAFGLRT